MNVTPRYRMSQHQAADPGPVTLEVPASHQALGQKLKNSYSEYSDNLRLLRHLSKDYSVWFNNPSQPGIKKPKKEYSLIIAYTMRNAANQKPAVAYCLVYLFPCSRFS